jgi:hypothetical protein
MTLKELKKEAETLMVEIELAHDNDEEWTSPRGNGVNSSEAYETARAFITLIRATTK